MSYNVLGVLSMNREKIRNFCIIAHIDHGKSTLADRFLEITGTVPRQKMSQQYLDRMELERERGITIKAQAVRMHYRTEDGDEYRLHLIDTPGHVDFSYEVSRSLAACEGAVLLVDASQGVEAQTVGNALLALEAGLVVIPAVNKIDLPVADVDRTRMEVAELLGEDPEAVKAVSAKTGEGVEELLQAVIEKVPPPSGKEDGPLRALVFDSIYDTYRGVVAFVRVMEGKLAAGMKVRFMASGAGGQVEEVGYFSPDMVPCKEIACGEVGYVITGIKDVSRVKVGDTVTDASRPASEPLPGYREPKPMVFAGVYPVDSDRFEDLQEALEKLRLNDASFTFQRESSQALGFGFRCGFLGLLHLEIVQERLEREYGLDLVVTAPNVVYEVLTNRGEVVRVSNPSEMPDPAVIKEVREPVVQATILTPAAYLGSILDLVKEKRGASREVEYLSSGRVEVRCRLPLAEMVVDFYDQLKSRSRGYASLDYELVGFFPADLVRLDILVNGEPVDAFSAIVERGKAHRHGKAVVRRLRELIPRQLFDVAVQAAVGGRIVARETVKALRKDVLAKCYGGDVTRKKKLLQKQKEGKKRMKMVGKVEIPQEAFISALRIREGDG
jgi:GTP-binding protein LepA